MNSQDAINLLQRMKQNKKVKQEFSTQKNIAESFTGTKNILVGTMADLTDLILKNKFEVVVKNFPNKQDKLLKDMNQNLVLINKTLSDILKSYETTNSDCRKKSNKKTKVSKL